MNKTYISIVIPCYNEGENITSLLKRYKSVVQNRTDIEIILVNDGSKDNTKEVLEKEKDNYPFLKVINVYPNAGYGNAVTTGLSNATGKYIGWTHGDLQTPPEDILKALEILEKSRHPETLYIKGKRHSRPFTDIIFTFGMGVFETLLFRVFLNDINAQPNIFPKRFFDTWINPPKDFSLDLYVYIKAKKEGFKITRFPVSFNPRVAGVSSWNTSWSNKYKFILRTIKFSLELYKKYNH